MNDKVKTNLSNVVVFLIMSGAMWIFYTLMVELVGSD